MDGTHGRSQRRNALLSNGRHSFSCLIETVREAFGPQRVNCTMDCEISRYFDFLKKNG